MPRLSYPRITVFGMTDDDDLGPSPAQYGDTLTVTPGEWTPIGDHGTEIYIYADQDLAGTHGITIAVREDPDA